MATEASSLNSTVLDSSKDTSGIGGHPRGLTTLFFTEMWERFSYYGMRALLVLFMTKSLGYADKTAYGIYAAYAGSIYLMSIPGGWIADNVLGTRRAVFVGGVIIALGHYSMAVPTTYTFFMGLVLIVLGTGLLKPNASAIVGELYSPEDKRRDAGFSLFYIGINIGALIAPAVCSFLGEKIYWHLGFGAAGLGMTFGLIQYHMGRERLAHVGAPPSQTSAETGRKAAIGVLFMAAISAAVGVLFFGPEIVEALGVRRWLGGSAADKLLSGAKIVVDYKPWIMLGALVIFLAWLFLAFLKRGERKPVLVIVIVILFSIIFWACYEQAGSSFTLFADRFTNRSVFGFEFPAGWFQTNAPAFVIVLTPISLWVWRKLGDRQPSNPVKFSLGLLFVGLGAAVITIASLFAVGGVKVGPWWLVGVYVLHTIGEICLYPTGLSTTAKLAPARVAGLMMGLYFLSISFGNFAAGITASYFAGESQEAMSGLFSRLAVVPIIAALILLALTPFIKKLMGKVR